MKKKEENPSSTLRYDGQWMDNKAAAASAAWTDGQRSPRRERRSYFTADCLMLPTRANYTDYSCESCMAELYNYKDSVRVIMCWRKRRGGKKKNTYLMEILVLQATAPLGDFQPRVVHYHLYLYMSLQRSFTGTWIHFTLLVATVSSALMPFFFFR